MTVTIDANTLNLEQVHYLLKLEGYFDSSIASFLSLEPITDSERQQLVKLRNNIQSYYLSGKILEGQVKFLFLSPLLWLSGFYNPQIKITLEEEIERINIEDEETIIKGRMDVLAAERIKNKSTETALWILVIESKKANADTSVGLPQLLTYAYTGLEKQETIWGLTTNGITYQFTYLQKSDPSTYQLFPPLNLLYTEQSRQILQILKAICQPYIESDC
ncbi:MAG: restriction endonuclease subunit R [Cyanobacteria bacterium SBLK]|nr:restriction endonuclease subunit R [Cyanobacteria bacterium SBLK]